METLNDFHQHLDELCRRTQAQAEALSGLEQAFAQQVDYLRRHDQARCIDDLMKRVDQEIKHIEYAEAAASSDSERLKTKLALLGLAAANIAGLLFPLKEHPMKLGARLAYDQLSDSEPYGTIIVGVGPGGVPRDVHVFPISRYARQQGVPEAKVIAELEAKGLRLFTPKAFSDFLTTLKDGILQGTSILPVAKPSTTLKFVPKVTEHKASS